MADQVLYSFKRYEEKYLITPEQESEILRRFRAYMKPDEFPHSQIGNIYYDTDHFDLIRASLEKPVYKEKLRVRSYGVPDWGGKVFVEIKKKYDGVVYKRRVSMNADQVTPFLEEDSHADKSQIGKEIEWFQKIHRTAPKAYIGYERDSFQGTEQSDLRITFDKNIRWRDSLLDLRYGRDGQAILPGGTVLMEIKIPGVSPLWLAGLLSDVGAFPVSFSKYGYCYSHFILNKETNYNNREMLHIA